MFLSDTAAIAVLEYFKNNIDKNSLDEKTLNAFQTLELEVNKLYFEQKQRQRKRIEAVPTIIKLIRRAGVPVTLRKMVKSYPEQLAAVGITDWRQLQYIFLHEMKDILMVYPASTYGDHVHYELIESAVNQFLSAHSLRLD